MKKITTWVFELHGPDVEGRSTWMDDAHIEAVAVQLGKVVLALAEPLAQLGYRVAVSERPEPVHE